MTPHLQRPPSWELGRRAFVAACLSLLTLGPALAQQPPSPSGEGKLIGRAAIDKLIGNTMSGTAQGSPYFAFYDKDGTVRMQRDGAVSTGQWSSDGEGLCEEFPEDEDETCYTLALDGDGATGIMTDADGVAYMIGILPGNSRKL
jgi:hypothetical protein